MAQKRKQHLFLIKTSPARQDRMGVNLQEETETEIWMDDQEAAEARWKKGCESQQRESLSLCLLCSRVNKYGCTNDWICMHIHTLLTFNRGNTLVIIPQQDVGGHCMSFDNLTIKFKSN